MVSSSTPKRASLAFQASPSNSTSANTSIRNLVLQRGQSAVQTGILCLQRMNVIIVWQCIYTAHEKNESIYQRSINSMHTVIGTYVVLKEFLKILLQALRLALAVALLHQVRYVLRKHFDSLLSYQFSKL
eukprot:GHVU01030615.1.p1 GENE.GHVU01030615.1~~GHVU01030615.1.p1  ORF type:complete len:130 (-),score=8.85 GHVU01030615.1:40-429(-)